MTRYRVTVTEQKAYFVDALTPERAGDKAIAMSSARIRPDYPSTITAKADVVVEAMEAAAGDSTKLLEIM